MVYKPTEEEERETDRWHAERMAATEAAIKAAAASTEPMKPVSRTGTGSMTEPTEAQMACGYAQHGPPAICTCGTCNTVMRYPVILNGDHAEFEREHANTPPEDRPDWPLPSFDAQDWAKAFVKMWGGDEQLMTAWFANALMRGYDEGRARLNEQLLAQADEALRGAIDIHTNG